MDKKVGFGCCDDCAGPGLSGAQAAECIPQKVEERVIPCGTRKPVGQERLYMTTTSQWLTRAEFKKWSRKEGKEVDPVIWFTEMGHGPIPADVKV